MLILWFRKKKNNGKNATENKANRPEKEQEEIIKQFRLEHPDTTVRDIMTEDGSLLTMVQDVRLWANIQN